VTDSDPKPSSPNRSLANIAGIVAVATLISKLAGLFRQQAIGAAFAVGPVADAYSFAYIIPGFLLILLGGINGPFHSAIVSVVAKQDRKDTAALLEAINTLVGLVLVGISVVLFLMAGGIIDTIAPGLAQTEPIARDIAVLQLRIMSPMALFAGLIGIGFGALNADSQFWLPSISPFSPAGRCCWGWACSMGRLGPHYQRRLFFAGRCGAGGQHPGGGGVAVVGPASGPVEVGPRATSAAV
jgi:putative peptidoglycan lipid II flippase